MPQTLYGTFAAILLLFEANSSRVLFSRNESLVFENSAEIQDIGPPVVFGAELAQAAAKRRGPGSSFPNKQSALEGKLNLGGPRGPPAKFAQSPPDSASGCNEEQVCSKYIKDLKGKANCPTLSEKMMMGKLRRAMLGEEGAGTLVEAIEEIQKDLTRLHPVANPNPKTQAEAEEFVKLDGNQPTGKLWDYIESEKGTAEMWCRGGAVIEVEIPRSVRAIPDAVGVDMTHIEPVDILEPSDRARGLLEAQKRLRVAAFGTLQDTLREAGVRTLSKLVEADPTPDEVKKPTHAKVAKKTGPQPYALPAVDAKLEQNLGLMLRKMDFSVKKNARELLKDGKVDYQKMFANLIDGDVAVVGEAGNKDSAVNAELMLTVMSQVPDADARNALLDAAEADNVLKSRSDSELLMKAPGGLMPSAAFIGAWAKYRAEDPQNRAKCVMSRFYVPETLSRLANVNEYVRNYYPIFTRFSEHLSDAISQFIAAFSSAKLNYNESGSSALAKKDYKKIEDKIVELSTVEGLKDKLANTRHELATAALPLLLVSNVLNKDDFKLRSSSRSGREWKPSFLDMFMHFAARTSNEKLARGEFAWIHSLTGDDAEWNGRRVKLTGEQRGSWAVLYARKRTSGNGTSTHYVKPENLVRYKSLLDESMGFCKELGGNKRKPVQILRAVKRPTWSLSIGSFLEELKSFTRELQTCAEVKLSGGETFRAYMEQVRDATAEIASAHALLVDSLGRAYLSLLPEDMYNGTVNMEKLEPKITMWQKTVTSVEDKTLPHPQPFVSLFDDYSVRTNIYNFCERVTGKSAVTNARTEHFRVSA